MGETVAPQTQSEDELLTAGTPVDVRSRYVGSWSRGFEVAEIVGDTYRVRRLSDGSVLPAEFSSDDVRARSQKKAGLWWY
ncbi:MAG: hypothetical protein E6G01_12010 [Actinobacteria bacterium]|nr:MAG: hypothetical protein E6G01_12010 [Actinomycetota bacterium]